MFNPENKVWVLYVNQGPGGWHILQCLDKDPNDIKIKGQSLLETYENRYGKNNIGCFKYLLGE